MSEWGRLSGESVEESEWGWESGSEWGSERGERGEGERCGESERWRVRNEKRVRDGVGE